MRSWLLAVKVAAVFMTVLLVFTSITLHLFASHVLRSSDVGTAHDEFVVMVLWIMLGTLTLIAGLAVWVTAPLRRMSRSMDRIAAGDLEHRVVVRGRDEGAAMGRSFNTMAERVHGMVVGQKELMAGISHELRSPLARMKLSLELLRRERGGAGRIDELEAEVDELNALVAELLLVSRIDLGAAPVEQEPLELEPLCRQAWGRVAGEAGQRGAHLQFRAGDGARGVLADRRLLLRALGNLFENAVRHAGAGAVSVTTERRGERVLLTVRDEGPGVDEALCERLFEPFFRVDPSRSRATGAGGLGLMIVRRAVEAHGGRVRARNATPSGLIVELDLPAP